MWPCTSQVSKPCSPITINNVWSQVCQSTKPVTMNCNEMLASTLSAAGPPLCFLQAGWNWTYFVDTHTHAISYGHTFNCQLWTRINIYIIYIYIYIYFFFVSSVQWFQGASSDFRAGWTAIAKKKYPPPTTTRSLYITLSPKGRFGNSSSNSNNTKKYRNVGNLGFFVPNIIELTTSSWHTFLSASFWWRLRNCAAACVGSTLERKGVAPLPTLTRSPMEKKQPTLRPQGLKNRYA